MWPVCLLTCVFFNPSSISLSSRQNICEMMPYFKGPKSFGSKKNITRWKSPRGSKTNKQTKNSSKQWQRGEGVTVMLAFWFGCAFWQHHPIYKALRRMGKNSMSGLGSYWTPFAEEGRQEQQSWGHTRAQGGNWRELGLNHVWNQSYRRGD